MLLPIPPPFSTVPPEVLFTTEFKLEGREDFGKPAKVSCSVLSSPDTGFMVNWLFKGKSVPLDQGKYRLQTTLKNKDITDYTLLIDDVQEGDLGLYTCRLTSDFHLESEDEVWIKFKNECEFCSCYVCRSHILTTCLQLL